MERLLRPRPHWAARKTSIGIVHGFRSGLEERNAKHLEALGQPVHFETFKLKYVIPQSTHTYTVDFRLVNGILVETKGIWDATDRAKHLFVRTQYPDLDIRIVFSRAASPLYKGSRTTLAGWATKHGFTFAEKLIPEAWVHEGGPKRKPEDVIKDGPLGYREILSMEVRSK